MFLNANNFNFKKRIKIIVTSEVYFQLFLAIQNLIFLLYDQKNKIFLRIAQLNSNFKGNGSGS